MSADYKARLGVSKCVANVHARLVLRERYRRHELQDLQRRCIAETGRPLHGDEVFAYLEELYVRKGGQIGYLIKPGR